MGGIDEFSPSASGCIIEFKSRGFHLPSCQIEFSVFHFAGALLVAMFRHGEIPQHANSSTADSSIFPLCMQMKLFSTS